MNSQTSSLGLRVLIASLAPLFIATLFCGWYFRDTGNIEGPLPELPLSLFSSTFLLCFVSFFSQRAISLFSGRMVQLAFLAALLFLISQSFAWSKLLGATPAESAHPMYAFNFYLMTALHGAHVVGGLVYSLIAFSSRGLNDERYLQRLKNHATYWHFLGITWVGILLNLIAIRVPNPENNFIGVSVLVVTAALFVVVIYYQALIIRLLWLRNEKVAALSSLLLPVAFLHVWARGEELRTHKLAFRWAIILGCFLVGLMFSATIYFGQFVSKVASI